MQQILLIFHIFLSIILIGLVLIQKGKGASMGAAFGSGASQTIFGSRGSIGFLVKLTIIVAALFFSTSIALTYLASHAAKNPKTQESGLLSDIEKMSKKISEDK